MRGGIHPLANTWRELLVLVLVCAAAAACGTKPDTSAHGTAAERPVHASARDRDWIFVSIDTLRADHLPFYGYERETAGEADDPFSLAWLAEQGTVYDSVWAPIGKTMPSLASFWTGEFPLEHGAVSNPTVLTVPTWAESFQAHGYRTHAAVANRAISRGCGLEKGFESYQMLPKELEPSLPGALLDRARPHIDAGEPLMLWAHFMAPHQPYTPPEELARRFSERPLTPADNDALYAYHAQPETLDEATRQAIIGLYDGEILAAAGWVQELLTGLDAAYRGAGRGGLLDEATVVFFSDHGEELAERHGYFLHAKSLYRGVLQVPLVVAGRGAAVGRQSQPRSLLDVLPELLALEAPAREVWAASWQTEYYALRDARWTLIHNPTQDGGAGPFEPPRGVPYPYQSIELYDRSQDLYEMVNVAERHPAEVERMLGRMQAWYQATPQGEVTHIPGGDMRQRLYELGYLEFAHQVIAPWTVEQWKQAQE